MIVCVLLPRFELAVAAGGREALLGEPVALAPEGGRQQLVGEVSLAAEAFGVRSGMRLGEALSRCPGLALLAPDPVAVAEAWDAAIDRLEGVGAAVEPLRPGLACFDARGLLRLHGGRLAGVLDAVRGAFRRPARGGVVLVPRLGAGPTRFLAVAAASRARARRPEVVAGAGELSREPVALLELREETAALARPLERLGVATLGDLAALPRAAVADRFGAAGLLAHDLVAGRDTPLRPRAAGERLEEALELPEPGSGEQLERALGMLVDRLLARRERRGRTLRAVVIAARLVEGGTWRERVVFREALADAARMRLALGGRLVQLPAPADALRLAVDRFGPPHASGRALFGDERAGRRARLREAVRQARAAAGPDAALRVLEVDPGSRVPERRMALAPFEVGGEPT